MLGGEFTVTTTQTDNYPKPYARASITGRLPKEYRYRVTINGTIQDDSTYGTELRLWFFTNSDGYKTVEYVGNLSYYTSDSSGVIGGVTPSTFLIMSDMDSHNAIDVWTNTAGTYTILIERVNVTVDKLLPYIIWGDAYSPVERAEFSGSTFNGYSIGNNALKNKRGTIAIGYSNIINSQFSFAIGNYNEIEATTGVQGDIGFNLIIGFDNYVTETSVDTFIFGMWNYCEDGYSTIVGKRNYNQGQENFIFGYNNWAVGKCNYIYGDSCYGQAAYEWLLGSSNSDTVTLYPTWTANTSYAVGDKITYTDGYGYECITANSDSSFTSSKWKLIGHTSDALLTVGNGFYNWFTRTRTDSNALLLDWSGNLRLNGEIYVNCNADSTGGTKMGFIPGVTSSDNGKLLQVSNGVWTPVSAGYVTASFVDEGLILGSLSSAEGVSF